MWLGIDPYPCALEKEVTPTSYERKHTQEAIKKRGEVFTPTPLVDTVLDEFSPEDFVDPTMTFLDQSCGNGQFLAAVFKRKRKNKISHKQALMTIYGCELDSANAEECRLRLLNGSTSRELRAIVDHNIVCADSLDPKHQGWKDVGFYWEKSETVELPDEKNWAEKLVKKVVAKRQQTPFKPEPLTWAQEMVAKLNKRRPSA